MAEKGQTEANCNLENNGSANEVGKRREEEKENSHIIDTNDFKNAIDRHDQDLKISRQTNIISDKISMNNSQNAKAHKSVLQPGIWASCS